MSGLPILLRAFFSLCLSAVCFNGMAQAPWLRLVNWPEPVGEDFKQRIISATDGNFWLMVGETENTGSSTFSQILKVSPDGVPVSAAILRTNPGVKLNVLDFAESDTGEKYILAFKEDAPLPSVVVGGELFVMKFSSNWALQWSRSVVSDSGFPVSSLLADLQVGADGEIFFLYFDSRYVLCCMSPAGSLRWSRTLQTGIQVPGPSGRVQASFILSEENQSVYFQGFINTVDGAQILRLDPTTGNTLAAAVFPGFQANDMVTVGGARLLVLGNPFTVEQEALFGLLNKDLAVEKSWRFQDARFFTHRLLRVADSVCYVYSNGFNGISIFRMHPEGVFLNGVQYAGLRGVGINGTGLALMDQERVVIPLLPVPELPNQTALLMLDSSLAASNCRPVPYCISFSPAVLNRQGINPGTVPVSIGSKNPGASWQIRTFSMAEFCSADLSIYGVYPDFNSEDTICAGASLQISGLQNGGALSWRWDFPGGDPASAEVPAPPSIRYDQPGTYTLRQVVRSACFTDSFTKTIVVLPQPTVVLPPNRTFCKDTFWVVEAEISNATTWSWQDGRTDIIRLVDSSGTYILRASYDGYCSVQDSFVVSFIELNAAFDTPVFACDADSLVVRAVDNPPGSAYLWDVRSGDGVIQDTGPVLATGPLTAGDYQIALSVSKDICMVKSTRFVTIEPSPEVHLGPDRRLQPGSSLPLVPVVSPPSAAILWSDGVSEINREISEPGVYTLVATLAGCRDVDTLVVYPPLQVYQPNAFKPGSSQNGFFTLFTGEGAQLEWLEVYDRWGGLMYRGSGRPGWDGSTARQPETDAGVYTYRAAIRLADGEWVQVSGDLTLIR
ncbi:MAG: hypothetical protein SFV52_11750 [Saprospiraceae bacterium]|nr:hypothetical protein [Saprospiraceae bacterium]